MNKIWCLLEANGKAMIKTALSTALITGAIQNAILHRSPALASKTERQISNIARYLARNYPEHALAQQVDRGFNKLYGWGLSRPGAFGYAANAESAQAFIDAWNRGIRSNAGLAGAVHGGWSNAVNIYNDLAYASKPQKLLSRRALQIPYNQLPYAEQKKDLNMVRLLRDYFSGRQPTWLGDAAYLR